MTRTKTRTPPTIRLVTLVSIVDLTCTLATTGCGSDARSHGATETPELPGVRGHTSSISQYGVTFTFTSEVSSGKFANGDYWVVGPLTIASVTPACDGEHHGWMVNPVPGKYDPTLPPWELGPQKQAFDVRAGSSFDASLIPELPFTAQPGTSIVKAISIDPALPTQRPVITTAVVLTVLDEAPPDLGATVFRPPYVGEEKPMYRLSELRANLLPSYAATPSAGSISGVTDRFQRLQLDYLEFDDARCLHPSTSMPEYGADVGSGIADGALRLMLDEPTDEKMPALVNYVQAGIDYYYTAKLGMRWQNQGGNSPGKRILLAFTAALLGDAEMIAFSKTGIESGPPGYLGGAPGMHEDLGLSRGNADTVLWATPGNGADYWAVVANGGTSGSKMLGDPYGFIDGGPHPGSAYQECCTTPIWKGEVLGALLMPELSAIWDRSHLIFEYTDRMETVGVWAQPDPCAPLAQGGGDLGDGTCVLDPDLNAGSTLQSFSCQAGKECGRFPADHGAPGPGGSKLANEMWVTYRSGAGN